MEIPTVLPSPWVTHKAAIAIMQLIIFNYRNIVELQSVDTIVIHGYRFDTKFTMNTTSSLLFITFNGECPGKRIKKYWSYVLLLF